MKQLLSPEHAPSPFLLNAGLYLIGTIVIIYLIRLCIQKTWQKQDPLELGTKRVYSNGDIVITQYSWLMDQIERITSRKELDSLEQQAYDFEATHRGHAWTGEMFSELLVKIQEQHNMLSVKNIQERV